MKKIKIFNFLAYIITPILLTSCGELFLKHNINKLHLTVGFTALLEIISKPLILLSLSLIVLGALLWLIAMSKFELSFMYPFLTLNYIFISIGSIIYLKEKVSLFTIIAILFIMLGLFFISRTTYSETSK